MCPAQLCSFYLSPILSISLEEGDQDNRKEGEQQEEEEDGALDRQECQAALASLRHAKWFQVRIKVVELEVKN